MISLAFQGCRTHICPFFQHSSIFFFPSLKGKLLHRQTHTRTFFSPLRLFLSYDCMLSLSQIRSKGQSDRIQLSFVSLFPSFAWSSPFSLSSFLPSLWDCKQDYLGFLYDSHMLTHTHTHKSRFTEVHLEAYTNYKHSLNGNLRGTLEYCKRS